MRRTRWPHLAQGQLLTLNLSTSSTSALQWLWWMAHHGWGKETPSITQKWWLLRDAKALCFPWPGTHSISHSTHEWRRYILSNDKMWPYQMGEVNLRVKKTRILDTNPRHQESNLQFFWPHVCGVRTSNFPRCLPSADVQNPSGEGFSRILFFFYPSLGLILWSSSVREWALVMNW